MGKRRKRAAEAPAVPAAHESALEDFLLSALWVLAFVLLTGVPDQKILRYKMLAVEGAAAGGLLAAFASWPARLPALWTRTPLDLSVALYAGGGLLFYALSPEHGASRLELVRMLSSAAAFFAASQTLPRLKRPEVTAWAWALCGGFAGAYALLQTRGGLGPLMVPQLDRPIFTFGNPIFFAAFLAASACAAGALAAATAGKTRLLAVACAALSLGGAWTTQTRAAVVGLAAAGGLAALLTLSGQARLKALGALALAGAGAAWHFWGRQWTHGLIWRDTLSLWLTHPFLGCGLGRFHIEFPAFASPALRALWPENKVIVNFAHNEYLQVLAETGVVGLALLAGVVGGWFGMLKEWSASPEMPRRALLGGFLLAAGALFAQNFFSPDLRFGVSSFLVFWSLGAAAALGWGEAVSLPEFPGRYAFAAAGGLAVLSWANVAVQPLLAQRRLAAEPGFYVDQGGEFDKAVSSLQNRLKENPGDADAAENLAFLFAKAKRWPEAIRYFELTANLAPTRPGPTNNLGNIAYSLGDRAKAIEYWGRSLQVAPDQIDARINLGKTLYEMGRLKESARNLEEVRKRDPKNEKAQVLLKKMIE